MRKLFFAVAALLCTGSAYAADMPLKAAPMVVPSNWTGFYIGINGGGVWGTTDTGLAIDPNDTFFNVANKPFVSQQGSNKIHNSGGLVGGQIGYLYELNTIIFGVEAGFDWMGARATINNGGIYPNNPGVSFNFNEHVSSDWLFTFLGRAGLDLGSWYPYVTGGLAVAELKYDNVFTDNFYPGNSSLSLSEVKTGFAIGGGIEWKWTNHWSLRGEYLYMQFDDLTGSSRVCTNAGACAVGTNQTNFFHAATFKENIARAALSYKW